MNFIYSEKLTMNRLFLIIDVVIILVLIFFMPNLIGLTAIILIVFMTASMKNLAINLTETELQFGFAWMKKMVYVKNIMELRAEEMNFRKFRGYGIKRARDHTAGFVVGPGEGIAFTDVHDGKKYFISTNKADELIKLLITYGAQKA